MLPLFPLSWPGWYGDIFIIAEYSLTGAYCGVATWEVFISLANKEDGLKIDKRLILCLSLCLKRTEFEFIRNTFIPLHDLIMEIVQIVMFDVSSFFTKAVQCLPGIPG